MSFLFSAFGSFHNTLHISLFAVSASDPRYPQVIAARTHTLLIEAIQLQTYRRRRLLRPSSDLVDGIKGMAKDSV